MIEVAPISMPQIDWRAFERLAGRNVLRHADAVWVDKNMPLAYISALADQMPEQALRFASPTILDHLHFGFAVSASHDVFSQIAVLSSRQLALTVDPKGFAVISGTLKDWDNVVVQWSTRQTTSDVRCIINQIQGFFEQAGLSLWLKYSKQKIDTETFILVPHD